VHSFVVSLDFIYVVGGYWMKFKSIQTHRYRIIHKTKVLGLQSCGLFVLPQS